MERDQRYLDAIRSMGILRSAEDMPQRKAEGQIEESIKKSGREGFEPVSSPYTNWLYQKYKFDRLPIELQKEILIRNIRGA